MEKRNRRLLEKDIIIKGKAAVIHEILLSIPLFDNNHEVTEFAAMIGIAFGKRVSFQKMNIENDLDNKIYKIGKETMSYSGKLLRNFYRFCMLLDEDTSLKERKSRAFNYDDNGEDAQNYEEIFMEYIYGGYMIIEEKILNDGPKDIKKKEPKDFVLSEYRLLMEMNNYLEEKVGKKETPMSSKDILARILG